MIPAHQDPCSNDPCSLYRIPDLDDPCPPLDLDDDWRGQVAIEDGGHDLRPTGVVHHSLSRAVALLELGAPAESTVNAKELTVPPEPAINSILQLLHSPQITVTQWWTFISNVLVPYMTVVQYLLEG